MSEPLPLSSVWSICVCLCSMMASLKKVRRHTGWFSSSAVFILRRWISNEMSLEVGRVMSREGGERRGLEGRWGVGWEGGREGGRLRGGRGGRGGGRKEGREGERRRER